MKQTTRIGCEHCGNAMPADLVTEPVHGEARFRWRCRDREFCAERCSRAAHPSGLMRGLRSAIGIEVVLGLAVVLLISQVVK